MALPTSYASDYDYAEAHGNGDQPRYHCDQHVWQSPDEPCPHCEANDEFAAYLRAREYGEDAPPTLCDHNVNTTHAACGKCEGL